MGCSLEANLHTSIFTPRYLWVTCQKHCIAGMTSLAAHVGLFHPKFAEACASDTSKLWIARVLSCSTKVLISKLAYQAPLNSQTRAYFFPLIIKK